MSVDTVDPEMVREVVLNSHGNLSRVRELIEAHPALVSVSAPWDETPIQAASHMGNREIAEWLLDRGAALDVFTAAMLGRGDEVTRFLDQDPSLAQAHGVHGMPILFFPAASGRVDMLQRLHDRGAEINDGAGGNTALHAAAMFGHVDATHWLLTHGADSEATDYEGKTPRERLSPDMSIIPGL